MSDLSPERVDELAGVLGEHRLHASMNICTGCDWRATPHAGSLPEQHETHRAQALVPLVARWVAEAWPCDNYRRPNTCLTAPSSVTARCGFCTAQATTEEQR